MPGFRILWSEYTKDNELTIFTKTSKRILIMKRLHWLFLWCVWQYYLPCNHAMI